MKTSRALLLAGSLSALLLSSCNDNDDATRAQSAAAANTSDAAAPTPDTARITDIARQVYVYGVPLVAVYQTIYAFNVDKDNPQYKGPFNSILNVARVFTPADTAFVTPNSDTPYSFSALDLRAEPVVISVPKMEPDRYFVFQLMDMYTFNFAYIGSRTTGNGGGNYLIAGPRWKGEKPAGIDAVLTAETEIVNVVGRTQLFNPGDLENVKAIQAQYKVQPLSAFASSTTPPAAAPIAWITPLPADAPRDSLEFFNQLAFLLQFATPAHSSEVALRQQFADIGIVPGQPFDASKLSVEQQAALKQGMQQGQALIDAKRASVAGRTDTLFGDRAFLHNDYVARATGTQMGIGANSREEAMYPLADQDANGQPLDGSKGRYTVTFKGGDLPPVDAFWSITMYDMPRQLLVANALDRYLINSPMLPQLKKDADGGLTIYLQSESPGKDKESNWLPAPDGPFMVAFRYYRPQKALLDDTWKTPPVVAQASSTAAASR